MHDLINLVLSSLRVLEGGAQGGGAAKARGVVQVQVAVLFVPLHQFYVFVDLPALFDEVVLLLFLILVPLLQFLHVFLLRTAGKKLRIIALGDYVLQRRMRSGTFLQPARATRLRLYLHLRHREASRECWFWLLLGLLMLAVLKLAFPVLNGLQELRVEGSGDRIGVRSA